MGKKKPIVGSGQAVITTTVDAKGRLTLPQELREEVGLQVPCLVRVVATSGHKTLTIVPVGEEV